MAETYVLSTQVDRWVVGNAALAASDEPDDLASATDRIYSVAVARKDAEVGGDEKISVHRFAHSTASRCNYLRARCIGATNNTSCVYNLYSGTLGTGGSDCALSLLGTLTFTIGTQLSDTAGYYFADTVVAVDGAVSGWSSKYIEHRTAESKVYLDGDDTLIIVPTTLECNAKLLLKFIS